MNDKKQLKEKEPTELKEENLENVSGGLVPDNIISNGINGSDPIKEALPPVM